MTKLTSIAVLSIWGFMSFSCGQFKSKNKKSDTSSSDIIDKKNIYWLTSKKMTPLRFLETMKVKGNQINQLGVVTMKDSFPENWVTKRDVDALIRLVNSKQMCNCFLNPLSSYIPPDDSADVGGYAI